MAFDGPEDGNIDPVTFQTLLCMFANGDVDAAYLEQSMGLSASQRTELDEIIATKPTALQSLGDAVKQAQWPNWVASVLMAGRIGIAEYNTPAKCRSALGLS